MEPSGQGVTQILELLLAFVLSALIGLEREYRQKSAGLRTYTIVGFAAALLMLVSKYGFTDVLRPGAIVLDPSRVAAQIVTGIGFIGGGLIFVRRTIVQGLTTAAVVWLTAAVGMACGAGLPVLAVVVTGGHFVVVFGFSAIARKLPRAAEADVSLDLVYADARGVLRQALLVCVRRGFAVTNMHVERVEPPRQGAVGVRLDIRGKGSVTELIDELAGIDGMISSAWNDESSERA